MISKLSLSIVFCTSFLLMDGSFADDVIGSSVDCTDVSVPYADDPNLTREEKLARMDRALFDSLNKFELCQSANNKQASSGGGGQAGGAGASGAQMSGSEGDHQDANQEGTQEGTQGEAGNIKSSASSGMSGTETPKPATPAPDVKEGGWAPVDTVDQNPNQSATGGTQAGGKLPEDIPAAANDDALAAQIRYAAENETDPKKKAQLWDEYRKYKGLPTQK